MSLFEKSEFQARVRKTKQAMQKRGIEVLLVTDPSNMNYLTGYDGWSFYVHQGVLVIIDREEPIWFGRMQDSNGARLTTWLSEDSIRGYEDHYVQSTLIHPMEFVADLLAEHGCEKRNLGVEMDSYYFTGQCLNSLMESLPEAELRDANLLVSWIRIIKSEQEIAYIRQAAEICKNVMQTAVDGIAPGEREGDVAAAVYQAQIAGTEEFCGDHPAIYPIMPSGIRTSTAHLSWTDRRYENGDIVLLELSGCKNRYHAPLARTVMVGDVPDDLAEVTKVTVDGLNKVVDFIKPGVTGEEVEAQWREAIAGSKVVKESRIGYSFGLSYPPDWGEHTLSLRPGDKTVLEPNMTIHVMPGIWLDKFGFECTESIRVTEDGCECFVDFPRELFVK